MKTKCYVYGLLLALLVAGSIPVRMGKANPTTISVSPITKTVQVGEQFAINISLDYAENLYGFEIWLSFDNSKLNATAINYVNYLNDPHRIWYQQVNNAGGYVTLAVSSTYPAPAKTGGSPPPLATVNFTAIDLGSSALHLYNTVLSDDQAKPIPHTTVDGIVHVTGGTHDVVVTNVTNSKFGCVPMPCVGQNLTVRVNVTVANQGNFTETFNVTAYANSTSIASQNVTLASGNSTVVAFIWNTTGFTKSNYTMSAVADTVPGEINTTNNNMTDGMVLVTLVGDVNGDRKVRVDDILAVATAFGSNWGEPKYSPNLDINDDRKIRVDDVLAAATHFGEGPW
jgi:hypothetical protein